MLDVVDPQGRPPPGVIDLARGHPDPALLPLEEFRTAAASVLARATSEVLQYGAGQGSGFYRSAVARLLSDRQGFTVDPDELFATSGISQALSLVCASFARAGDVVLVEEPTYFLALKVFRDHGLLVRSVAVDDDGIRLDALAEALEEVKPAFLYLVPTFQNPTGVTLSHARREELAALARRHDLLVVADEVYQLLDHGRGAPTAFAAWLDEYRLLSLGSFSKILGPGLRLGWAHGAAPLIDALVSSGVIDSGGGSNPVIGTCVAELINTGFQAAHLDGLNAEYAGRAAALRGALQRHLPKAELGPSDGGYFIWVRLPGLDSQAVAVAALAAGVRVQPGQQFSPAGRSRDALRLCFAYYPAEQLEEGAARLGRVVAQSFGSSTSRSQSPS